MSEYRSNGKPTASANRHGGWIELPVAHKGQRQDKYVRISMNRAELENLKAEIDMALQGSREEMQAEILDDYEQSLRDELDNKLLEKEKELSGASEDEIRTLWKAHGRKF